LLFIVSVDEVIRESRNAWTIKFSPLGNKKCINYYPGQFHFITLQRSNGLPVEEHPFTISSSPLRPESISSCIGISMFAKKFKFPHFGII
jgi:predicted ferric reductase